LTQKNPPKKPNRPSTFLPSWLVVGIHNEKIVQGNYSPTEPATTDHL
jgi:hypothetical protein